MLGATAMFVQFEEACKFKNPSCQEEYFQVQHRSCIQRNPTGSIATEQ